MTRVYKYTTVQLALAAGCIHRTGTKVSRMHMHGSLAHPAMRLARRLIYLYLLIHGCMAHTNSVWVAHHDSFTCMQSVLEMNHSSPIVW